MWLFHHEDVAELRAGSSVGQAITERQVSPVVAAAASQHRAPVRELKIAGLLIWLAALGVAAYALLSQRDVVTCVAVALAGSLLAARLTGIFGPH